MGTSQDAVTEEVTTANEAADNQLGDVEAGEEVADFLDVYEGEEDVGDEEEEEEEEGDMEEGEEKTGEAAAAAPEVVLIDSDDEEEEDEYIEEGRYCSLLVCRFKSNSSCVLIFRNENKKNDGDSGQENVGIVRNRIRGKFEFTSVLLVLQKSDVAGKTIISTFCWKVVYLHSQSFF